MLLVAMQWSYKPWEYIVQQLYSWRGKSVLRVSISALLNIFRTTPQGEFLLDFNTGTQWLECLSSFQGIRASFSPLLFDEMLVDPNV